MNDSTIDQLDYADQTNYYAGPFCDCGDATDDYDRALRHVTTAAGDNLGEVLIAEGYADTTSFPHSLTNDYNAAADAARDRGAGLWAACR